ncbi:spidroin-2-like [Capricornis sumatraensis]|uniref:spidroin-2-like n=1 Tax=Capricornis sumatraensis TaxID=34865 RepID=UPI003604DD80
MGTGYPTGRGDGQEAGVLSSQGRPALLRPGDPAELRVGGQLSTRPGKGMAGRSGVPGWEAPGVGSASRRKRVMPARTDGGQAARAGEARGRARAALRRPREAAALSGVGRGATRGEGAGAASPCERQWRAGQGRSGGGRGAPTWTPSAPLSRAPASAAAAKFLQLCPLRSEGARGRGAQGAGGAGCGRSGCEGAGPASPPPRAAGLPRPQARSRLRAYLLARPPFRGCARRRRRPSSSNFAPGIEIPPRLRPSIRAPPRPSRAGRGAGARAPPLRPPAAARPRPSPSESGAEPRAPPPPRPPGLLAAWLLPSRRRAGGAGAGEGARGGGLRAMSRFLGKRAEAKGPAPLPGKYTSARGQGSAEGPGGSRLRTGGGRSLSQLRRERTPELAAQETADPERVSGGHGCGSSLTEAWRPLVRGTEALEGVGVPELMEGAGPEAGPGDKDPQAAWGLDAADGEKMQSSRRLAATTARPPPLRWGGGRTPVGGSGANSRSAATVGPGTPRPASGEGSLEDGASIAPVWAATGHTVQFGKRESWGRHPETGESRRRDEEGAWRQERQGEKPESRALGSRHTPEPSPAPGFRAERLGAEAPWESPGDRRGGGGGHVTPAPSKAPPTPAVRRLGTLSPLPARPRLQGAGTCCPAAAGERSPEPQPPPPPPPSPSYLLWVVGPGLEARAQESAARAPRSPERGGGGGGFPPFLQLFLRRPRWLQTDLLPLAPCLPLPEPAGLGSACDWERSGAGGSRAAALTASSAGRARGGGGGDSARRARGRPDRRGSGGSGSGSGSSGSGAGAEVAAAAAPRL